MKKTDIFVTGFPRSGNTWVARLLGDVLDSQVKARNNKIAIADEGEKRPGEYIVRQEHSGPDQFERGDKVVLVIRDPRDTIVSAMHYWGIKDIETAAYCVIYGKWPTPQGSGWTNLYHDWFNAKNKISYIARYERFHGSNRAELESMLKALQIKPVKNIQEVVERQSFKSRKQYAKQHGRKMPFGPRVQEKALRKGIVGDWENYFTPDLFEKIKDAKPNGINFVELAARYKYYVLDH